MKKDLWMLVMMMSVTTYAVKAQLEKGNVFVGGDIADFDLSLNSGNNFIVTLTPKAAWFIQNSVAVGAYIDFGLNTTEGQGTTVNYGLGGLGRYYYNPDEGSVVHETKFFFEVNAGFQGVNVANGDNTNGLGLGMGPGVAHFITTNISLEALLKYNGVIGFGSSTTSSRLQLGVGFLVYLPGKQARNVIKESQ
jgi:hypothetical protein